jgi:hypothetical protein
MDFPIVALGAVSLSRISSIWCLVVGQGTSNFFFDSSVPSDSGDSVCQKCAAARGRVVRRVDGGWGASFATGGSE